MVFLKSKQNDQVHLADLAALADLAILVEEQILVAVQQTDDGGAVVGCGPHHRLPVSALKVRLDHLVVFTVTQGQRADPGALQPEVVDELG